MFYKSTEIVLQVEVCNNLPTAHEGNTQLHNRLLSFRKLNI